MSAIFQNRIFSSPDRLAFYHRLHEISLPIKAYWGKFFPIIPEYRIENAAIDFKTIYCHPNINKFSDEVLFMALAHEWAHRMISPCSWGTHKKIIDTVKKQLNVDYKMAKLYAEPAIELLVDRANCSISPWAHVYERPFLILFKQFLNEHLENINQKTCDKKDSEQFYIGLNFALRMSNVSDTPLPEAIVHFSQSAQLLRECLFDNWQGFDNNDDPHHISRICNFAALMRDILPDLSKHNLQNIDIFDWLLRHGGNGSTISDGFSWAQASNNSFETSPVPDQSTPGNVSHHADADANIFNLQITRQVINILKKHGCDMQTNIDVWQPSDGISCLDLKSSYRLYPKLIPGLTTMKKTSSPRPDHNSTGHYTNLCLVVDDSGSMENQPALIARSLCQGINLYCSQNKYPLGLISFGGEIDFSQSPGYRHNRISNALKTLNGSLGGTCLEPALKRLHIFVKTDPKIRHALIVTDAEAYDWSDCNDIAKQLLQAIDLTVLLINGEIPNELKQLQNENIHLIRIFQINPESVDTLTLKEILK